MSIMVIAFTKPAYILLNNNILLTKGRVSIIMFKRLGRYPSFAMLNDLLRLESIFFFCFVSLVLL